MKKVLPFTKTQDEALERILDLVQNADDLTYSDAQGVAMAIVMQYVPSHQIKEWERAINCIIRTDKLDSDVESELENISHEMMSYNL